MTLSMNKRRPVIIGPDTPNWAKETDVWVNTSNNTLYRYDGTEWDVIGSMGASAVSGYTQEQIEDFAAALLNHANHSGLTASYNDNTGQVILSASASGGGSSGLTLLYSENFSAQSSLFVPGGTFTSTYNDYKIRFIVNSSSTSNALGLRLIASDVSSNENYYTVRDGGSSERSNWDRFVMVESAVGRGAGQFYDIELYGPALSIRTFFKSSVYGFSGSQQFYYQYGGIHNVQSSYDAASIYVAEGGGNVTGYFAVYGYNK